MASDNEQEYLDNDNQEQNDQKDQQDQHGIFNGRFKANPKDGELFLKFIDTLDNQFDGIPKEPIITLFWGEERSALELLIKKSNKREKKINAKFIVKGLEKPNGAYALFRNDYIEICKQKEIKFTLQNLAIAYKKLSPAKVEEYKKKALKEKSEYEIKYNALRLEAIEKGEFPADAPKKAISTFLAYLTPERRAEIALQYTGIEQGSKTTFISKTAGKMWKALSVEEKAVYEKDYALRKENHNKELKTLEIKNAERLKKNGNVQDVNIETTGVKAAKIIKNVDVNIAVGIDNNIEEDSEIKVLKIEKNKSVKPTVAKPSASAKAATTKPTAAKDASSEDEVIIPVAKPSASAKAASVKATATAVKATAAAKDTSSEQEDEEKEIIIKPIKDVKPIKGKAVIQHISDTESDSEVIAKPVIAKAITKIAEQNEDATTDKNKSKAKPKAK